MLDFKYKKNKNTYMVHFLTFWPRLIINMMERIIPQLLVTIKYKPLFFQDIRNMVVLIQNF